MAGKRERQNGTWEYVFKRKGLQGWRQQRSGLFARF